MPSTTPLILCEGLLDYYQGFIPLEKANSLFEHLKNTEAWRSDNIRLFGKSYVLPRLQFLMGNHSGIHYTYSGIRLEALPWTDEIKEIKQLLENQFGVSFNAALLNLYRNGHDSNGWHSDNEPELGQNPLMISVSLGASRNFCVKKKTNHHERFKLRLSHGDVILMHGALQQYWLHTVPKEKKCKDIRINLTFRTIMN